MNTQHDQRDRYYLSDHLGFPKIAGLNRVAFAAAMLRRPRKLRTRGLDQDHDSRRNPVNLDQRNQRRPNEQFIRDGIEKACRQW